MRCRIPNEALVASRSFPNDPQPLPGQTHFDPVAEFERHGATGAVDEEGGVEGPVEQVEPLIGMEDTHGRGRALIGLADEVFEGSGTSLEFLPSRGAYTRGRTGCRGYPHARGLELR